MAASKDSGTPPEVIAGVMRLESGGVIVDCDDMYAVGREAPGTRGADAGRSSGDEGSTGLHGRRL